MRRARVRMGETEPVTVEQIAADSGQTVEEVRGALDQLEHAGWIEPAIDGRYYLCVPADLPLERG